jgi:hypothetical protein
MGTRVYFLTIHVTHNEARLFRRTISFVQHIPNISRNCIQVLRGHIYVDWSSLRPYAGHTAYVTLFCNQVSAQYAVLQELHPGDSDSDLSTHSEYRPWGHPRYHS